MMGSSKLPNCRMVLPNGFAGRFRRTAGTVSCSPPLLSSCTSCRYCSQLIGEAAGAAGGAAGENWPGGAGSAGSGPVLPANLQSVIWQKLDCLHDRQMGIKGTI